MDHTRMAYWRHRLRPIRPGAEPVEIQLARRLAGMWVITGLTLFIALFMLAIFVGFGRVDVGLRVAGVVFLPATTWFWFDYARCRMAALAYLREKGESPGDDAPPG